MKLIFYAFYRILNNLIWYFVSFFQISENPLNFYFLQRLEIIMQFYLFFFLRKIQKSLEVLSDFLEKYGDPLNIYKFFGKHLESFVILPVFQKSKESTKFFDIFTTRDFEKSKKRFVCSKKRFEKSRFFGKSGIPFFLHIPKKSVVQYVPILWLYLWWFSSGFTQFSPLMRYVWH